MLRSKWGSDCCKESKQPCIHIEHNPTITEVNPTITNENNPTNTFTPTNTNENNPTNTNTNAPVNTTENNPTNTNAPVNTFENNPTNSFTPTNTNNPTNTFTPTNNPTNTFTPTNTNNPTNTFSPVITFNPIINVTGCCNGDTPVPIDECECSGTLNDPGRVTATICAGCELEGSTVIANNGQLVGQVTEVDCTGNSLTAFGSGVFQGNPFIFNLLLVEIPGQTADYYSYVAYNAQGAILFNFTNFVADSNLTVTPCTVGGTDVNAVLFDATVPTNTTDFPLEPPETEED